MQVPSSYASIKPYFTSGKISGVGNCLAAWRHQKTNACTSIVYVYTCPLCKFSPFKNCLLSLYRGTLLCSNRSSSSAVPSGKRRNVLSWVELASWLLFPMRRDDSICDLSTSSNEELGRIARGVNFACQVTRPGCVRCPRRAPLLDG